MKLKGIAVILILLISVVFVAGCVGSSPQKSSLQVKNTNGNPLSGAIVIITQNGPFGTHSVIGHEEVDSSGLVYISLNKNSDYTVNISYNGTQETQDLNTSDADNAIYSIIWQ